MRVAAADLGLVARGTLVVPARATLHVASEKPSKVEPARAWLSALLGEGLLGVRTHAVPSGVPEQPIGVEAGARGAANRLHMMGAEPPAVRVAIESTILLVERPGAEEAWVGEDGRVAVDVAAIVVEAGAGEVLLWSDGVAIPARYVEAARRASTVEALGWSTTVGAQIAAELGVCADDWRAALAGRSRGELIAEALAHISVTRA